MKRPYKVKGRMSKLALAARRANLEKARAAPKTKIYRLTEKRQAASRANLAKAMAARRSPRGVAAARLNALSHGIFVKNVAASVARMGESVEEFRLHHALLRRLFAPEDELERGWVERLADLHWKRLRFIHALRDWEMQRFVLIFEPLEAASSLTAEETSERAQWLSRSLGDFLDYLYPLGRFQSRIDRLLRKLIRKRSHGLMGYKAFNPFRAARPSEVSKLESELNEYLDEVAGDEDENEPPHVRIPLR